MEPGRVICVDGRAAWDVAMQIDRPARHAELLSICPSVSCQSSLHLDTYSRSRRVGCSAIGLFTAGYRFAALVSMQIQMPKSLRPVERRRLRNSKPFRSRTGWEWARRPIELANPAPLLNALQVT